MILDPDNGYCRLAVISMILACSVNAFAQTGTDQSAAKASLTITATVVPSVYLTITSHESGAPVESVAASRRATAATVDFGNVDAIASDATAPGVSVSRQTAGALYTTPVILTPYFSGFDTAQARITVIGEADAATAGLADILEGHSPSTVDTLSASTPTIVTTRATSGLAVTRYVGLLIKQNATSVSTPTPVKARLIYQVSVQ